MGPKDLRYGNSLLADIVVVKDSMVNGEVSCLAGKKTEIGKNVMINAELLKFDTDNPELVVCPFAFTLGAFSGKGYPGAPVKTCDSCYPRISKEMETIGMALLHEYTHWNKLVSPVLTAPPSVMSTHDWIDGAFKTRLEHGFIDAATARYNGDSYAWLANEIWWTQACAGSHGPLTAPLRGDN